MPSQSRDSKKWHLHLQLHSNNTCEGIRGHLGSRRGREVVFQQHDVAFGLTCFPIHYGGLLWRGGIGNRDISLFFWRWSWWVISTIWTVTYWTEPDNQKNKKIKKNTTLGNCKQLLSPEFKISSVVSQCSVAQVGLASFWTKFKFKQTMFYDSSHGSKCWVEGVMASLGGSLHLDYILPW